MGVEHLVNRGLASFAFSKPELGGQGGLSVGCCARSSNGARGASPRPATSLGLFRAFLGDRCLLGGMNASLGFISGGIDSGGQK